ncbi:MAG: hypothetical protein NZ895_04980 [Archaeoglobaceae archaeon]|nr:hypothetical protein [Archaeoglobaceae archaeon]MCX8152738.1 hypothetical protein [Archaeoglobaceae archaeon]MDW8013445.1 hypothetical protein [Archaeoglobaceae archaeon]
MKFNLSDFEAWLRERGYDKLMGEENLKIFLELGFASLLFQNSNLLSSFIFNKLGIDVKSERIDPRIRFETSKKIEKIVATKDEIEFKFREPLLKR